MSAAAISGKIYGVYWKCIEVEPPGGCTDKMIFQQLTYFIIIALGKKSIRIAGNVEG